RSGLQVVTWGAAVCRIEEEGCNYPLERCFCQCLSTPCRFWSYWQWQDGRWIYSPVGASQRQVSAGSVDAWVWGDGQSPPAVAPSLELCPPVGSAGTLSTPISTRVPDAPAPGTDPILPEPYLSELRREYSLFLAIALALSAGLWQFRRIRRQTEPTPPHTLSWLAWLLAAAYLSLVNQQPLHSFLLILSTGTVFTVASRYNPQGQGWRTFLRLGLSVWLIALLFNLLSAHAGRFVLFSLPQHWPVIGGPITLEALLYGMASGANLFAILLVFATFNLGMETQRLLRWVPVGLFQAGLVVSIALAFVPQMMASASEIREAQRVRGVRFRSAREWIALFVPLLTTALERSLMLAESMEARGFGGVPAQSSATGRRLLRLGMIGGLAALLIGLLWRFAQGDARVGTAWLLAGFVLTMLALYTQGRCARRTFYRREPWQQRDTVLTLASAAALALAILSQRHLPGSLAYYPYPPFSPWPRLAWPLALAIGLLAVPATLWHQREPHAAHLQSAEQRDAPI
ncbi:MAG: energy-coupling factor transporter transmembrane protein EcfT, partial [Chloroflexi bacterium]|nr:energy-coupling factor transporter transmembrane protein EcfT [Chloroflexota bacterium]